jgi:hypothetical protein
MISSAYKLADFFRETLSDRIKDVLIVSNNGAYELFGRYRINQRNNLYCITDIVTKKQTEFSILKAAVAWCTFASSGKDISSKRLYYLDLKLASLDIDIKIHRDRIKKSSLPSKKQLHLVKLQEDIGKRRHILSEIEKIINTSKELQAKKFSSVQKRKNKICDKY